MKSSPYEEDFFSLSEEDSPIVTKKGVTISKQLKHITREEFMVSADLRHGSLSVTTDRGVHSSTTRMNNCFGAKEIGVHPDINKMSDLHGTKDNINSYNTFANDTKYDDDLDQMDQYIFDPQQTLETEFLDEDLEQQSTSRAI
ncbi:hypothetical protein NDU88_009419 [Pleurodeles waltl]|uniref:Uncharacterized protein n=1 Tax=Pleurodeles waltl TaxID=8319 RepID=A0AAV7QSM3_PLEWA|nr:hypothetical protein NDU88_009419 [Pleurodeles waltl]